MKKNLILSCTFLPIILLTILLWISFLVLFLFPLSVVYVYRYIFDKLSYNSLNKFPEIKVESGYEQMKATFVLQEMYT